MVRTRDVARVAVLAAVLTTPAACGTTVADPAGDAESLASADEAGTSTEDEGECGVTRHISLPAAGSPEARESTTAFAEPAAAAAGFVAELLDEYETNPELAVGLERGHRVLAEQEASGETRARTVGTEDGAAILAAARHQALLDLQDALDRGTAVVEEDEGSVTYYLPDAYDSASVVAVEWGDEGWVVDGQVPGSGVAVRSPS